MTCPPSIHLSISTGIRGRGVFSTHPIPASTLIETSPILLFSKEEYSEHGKFTLLDHYTFVWPNGRMALALGLGSLFNHSEQPNVSFSLDLPNECIKYTTTRPIEAGEELCIFYGHSLWFELAEGPQASSSQGINRNLFPPLREEADPFQQGDPDEILLPEELPFKLHRLPPEEETVETVQTVEAWAADITEPRYISTTLKWIQRNGFDTPDLEHLKRVNKTDNKISVLLTTSSEERPSNLPEQVGEPYLIQVPESAAVTVPAMNAKNHYWPTVFAPKRKDAAPEWTRGQVKSAWEAMRTVLEASIHSESGELPIAAHVQVDSLFDSGKAFTTKDTRTAQAHPLKHAILDLIREVAGWRASSTSSSSIDGAAPIAENGTNYLLTDQVLFCSHEPCIMCSMALLHSRVKELHFIFPMAKTGGCGGATCLSALPGVNHRFRIYIWDPEWFGYDEQRVRVDDGVDI